MDVSPPLDDEDSRPRDGLALAPSAAPAPPIEREHMFDKVVTPSDVGKLNRLVIPKQHAEKYFPLDSSTNEKGLLLNFEDRNGKPWRFRYSYWNSSQSYVMTKGWSRFVKEKKLDAGDIVSFQRGVGEFGKDRLFIDWRQRPDAPDPPSMASFQLPGQCSFPYSGSATAVPWGPLLLRPGAAAGAMHMSAKRVIELLDIEDDGIGVRIVGIHGANGMGKTTIAKAVYDRLSSDFDSCSFLAEIGETARNGGDIQLVQTKLISDILERDDVDVATFKEGIEFFLDVFRSMKVLIVLDDVEDKSHLNDLVGDKLDWFGPGSRIIATSEDGEIMQEYVSRSLARTYEVTGMNDDRALELLWEHASAIDGSIPDCLESKEPIIKATGQVPFAIKYADEYLVCANHIIKATGNVPFVIEVIGTFLLGKPVADWWKLEDSIKPQVKYFPRRWRDCGEILRICYEALDDKQKEIFWDIAWFANGVDSRIASYMWAGQYLSSPHHVLMPLAKIGGDNILWMHKMLRSLSRTMHQAETNYPGSRSRRYMNVTDLELFKKKEGKEEVEVLCFDFTTLRLHTFTETDFKSMPNIRFLKLDHASMTGNFANVFPKLRWLRWQGCPRDFEATEFSPMELVILDISWSKVTDGWGGWRLMKMEQLKVLNLTGCTDLLISPKFSSFPNLEMLILERCSRLVYLDPSVGDLKKLLCLNLKSCTELSRLPAELGGLEALKEILIDGTSVEEIPLKGYSKVLETLSASNCLSLSHLDGVGELVKLRCLSLRNCHWIQELPESIGRPGSPLEELDVSGTGISELPDSFGNLRRLRVLKMDDCFISKFPSFIWDLQSLEEIHASSCMNLEVGIPGDIGKLKNLRILRLRSSAISSLPPEIVHLSKLETLDVLDCDMLHELPALPSSLVIVHLSPNLKEKVPCSSESETDSDVLPMVSCSSEAESETDSDVLHPMRQPCSDSDSDSLLK